MLFAFSANRLSDFTISVGDSVNAKQCIQRFEQLPAGTQLWCHRPLRGRIVTIRLSKTNFLTLCEVQVQGTLITGSLIFVSERSQIGIVQALGYIGARSPSKGHGQIPNQASIIARQ